MRRCIQCGTRKPDTLFKQHTLWDGRRRIDKLCRDCWNAKARDRWAMNRDRRREVSRLSYRKRKKEFRDAAIKKYGGKCTKCGNKKYSALCFHHTKRNGEEERGRLGTNLALYKKLSANKRRKTIELLCLNCHSKEHEGEVFIL